ncbi:DNA-binding transcriptional regulator [Escherichia coli]|uniref:DNA-binding transcriptional regulator n=1 Tax=Escherichia coli TaxID=562 RepID=A0A376VVR0_ECOLX|nr:DNA-binding transcriptional regulator [Escherichia coli]
MAKKAGQIVGRITAQIDTLHRECYGEDTGHFGMIDAIDDPQVFAALFGAAEAWLKSQGASKISGPFSLNINQESGLLIEGFDTPPCAMMPHGKPWYAAHMNNWVITKALIYWRGGCSEPISLSLRR